MAQPSAGVEVPDAATPDHPAPAADADPDVQGGPEAAMVDILPLPGLIEAAAPAPAIGEPPPAGAMDGPDDAADASPATDEPMAQPAADDPPAPEAPPMDHPAASEAPVPDAPPVAAPAGIASLTAELGPGMRFRLRQIGYGSDEALADADPAVLRQALGDISDLLNVELWIAQARARRG